MKKIIIISAAILGILLGTLAYNIYFPIVKDPNGVRFALKPGKSVKTFVEDLYSQKLIHNRLIFSWYIRFSGNQRSIKAGEYLFPKGSNPSSILNQIASGKGSLYRSFTIIAGWNFKQLRSAINQNLHLHQTIKNLSDKEVMVRVNGQLIDPEGQFFPDTYYFIEGSSDIVILKRSYQLMQTKLNNIWRTRDAKLPYKNVYEALTAASLIEKEAYLDQERAMIAGVLVNRLRKNMLLQFDPTVIYGLGTQYVGKIRKEDLTKNTPYNTYVNRGLPPTPIAFSCLKSLMAAMHPMPHKYLYFVARGDGSHHFSENLAQHNEAVALIKKTESALQKKAEINNPLSHVQPHENQLKQNDNVINLNDLRKKHQLNVASNPVKLSENKNVSPAPIKLGESKNTSPAPIKLGDNKNISSTPIKLGENKNASPASIKLGDNKNTSSVPIKLSGNKNASSTPIKLSDNKNSSLPPVKLNDSKNPSTTSIKSEKK